MDSNLLFPGGSKSFSLKINPNLTGEH